MKAIVIALAWSAGAALFIHAAPADGWTTVAPREEIRPDFQRTEASGKSGHGALVILADEREGLHGWWQKLFPSAPDSTTAFPHGVARSTSRCQGEPPSSSLCDGLQPLAEPVCQLFAANHRLAQEHVGWEFLQRVTTIEEGGSGGRLSSTQM